MRDGAEYFTQPVPSAQRRYEAMRAYFVDDMPAAQVADRFGYSTASVHQMATLLRGGRMEFFAAAKPGPKGPRKAGQVHDRVLALRADGHSVTEIAAALHAEGTPVSAQTVWTILDAEGIGRLVRDDTGRRGTPARLDPVKATTLSPSSWPAGTHLPCDHAGLFLLLPAIVSLGLPDLIPAAAYPGTRALSAWQSIGTLLLAKCARRARTHHIDALTDDTALALALNLTALPKANHLRTYAYRVRRDSNRTLLSGLVNALRRQGLATGEAGFNCDFHAIRHHGEVVPLEKHYVPKRSQRTRAVLTFFAQDHASTEMVYANADITKAEQAREIIAFADYWQQATGSDPGQRLDHPPHRPRRALPPPTDPRTSPRHQRHRQPGTPDRRAQHRPRRTHPDHHQRPHHTSQRPVRPLRRTHDHRKRARRLHLRLPPRRAHLRPTAQRRPRHHPDRGRRQPLPHPRPNPAPLRDRNPRQDLATLPRRHRHPQRHQRRHHRQPQPAHLPPRPHRRRLRRPRPANPLAEQPAPTLRLPTTMNLTRPPVPGVIRRA